MMLAMAFSCTRHFCAAALSALLLAAASGAAQAALDPCLVGTWRSESIENTFINIRGGAGVMMSIKPDGALGIDYNGMDALESQLANPSRQGHQYYGGWAFAMIASDGGQVKIVRLDKTRVFNKFVYPDGHVSSNPLQGLGPGAPGMNPKDNSYNCNASTLSGNGGPAIKFVYRRTSSQPTPSIGASGSAGPPPSRPGPAGGPGGPYVPIPQGQFCVRNAGAIGDIAPCTGNVRTGNVVIVLRLKRSIPSALTGVTFYLPNQALSSLIFGTISGSGTTVNSEYTITTGPGMCVNTGVTYAVRVTIGGTSYGDVGNFVPDCR